jgi:hypothetical protein
MVKDDRAMMEFVKIVKEGTRHVVISQHAGGYTLKGDLGGYDDLGFVLLSAYRPSGYAIGDVFIPWTAVAYIGMAIRPSEGVR